MLKMDNIDQKKGEIFDENSWVVAVKSSLEGEIKPDKSRDGLIHTVPKSLLNEKSKVLYIPQVISFGPYHFPKMDALDDDKGLKSEVALKVHLQISSEGGLNSVVEKFKEKKAQEKIKESYAKEFELSSEACAWMIVRDACFVLEVLRRFREDEDPEKGVPAFNNRSGEDEDKEKGVSTFIDSILSRKRHHPLLTYIVKDMLKMENQLPLWVLEEVRVYTAESNDGIWFESALRNLSPIEVAEGRIRSYKTESHILQLLHDYIVDRYEDSAPSNPGPDKSWVSTIRGILPKILKAIVLYIRSEILSRLASPKTCIKWLFKHLGYAIIFLLLSPLFVMLFILGVIFVILYYAMTYIFVILSNIKSLTSREEEESHEEEEKSKQVPTAMDLKRAGVKFKKLVGDKIGVSHIKFEESNSTLYLPKFKFDDLSEVILRNLIALEIFSQEEQKPITRYGILMNDLINTSADVGILRRANIISRKVGSDKEIAELWNSMATPIEMPRYDSIDIACSEMKRYHKTWWKSLTILKHGRLWIQFIGLLTEFVVVRCRKPWFFLSLLGGLILLLLTLVQVICLFESCEHI